MPAPRTPDPTLLRPLATLKLLSTTPPHTPSALIQLFTVGADRHAPERRRRATRFSMREQYTGPLAGMIFKSVPDLGPSFQNSPTG